MRNIIALIQRLHVLLLFLALQGWALVMYFNSSYYPQAVWLNTCTDLVGNIQERRTRIAEYLRLAEINEELSVQNAALREQLAANYTKVSGDTYKFNDTLYLKDWTYHPARVVNNSVITKSNFITLDKGSIAGITRDMGVIANNCIIGKVLKVSPHYAVAMSVLHTDFQASIKIKGTQVLGTLKWDGSPEFAMVNDIPKDMKVTVGDTLVTTGFSDNFPEGCVVGTVYTHEAEPDRPSHSIVIKLATNFRAISYVQVVGKNALVEQETLETAVQPE
ncbi:MAG: rod shape-determining protein MreC [Flavobacteriales bacterium]|nr:rod shape-determining protein MreC [Flavobacteriales bacterium]